jgi:amino acid transporter
MLERLVSGWRGKILVLVLLGFAGTDFVITKTLSAADAAEHLIHNPLWRAHAPEFLTGALGGSEDHPRMILTMAMLVMLGAMFLRGFKEVIGTAAVIVGGYLFLNVIVIGSGIFLVPTTMIQRVGSPEMVFVVWVVGGVLSLFGALSYAELSAAMPEAGGEYVYLREAYGPLWSFLYGWMQMWVGKSGSVATLATAFFYYLTSFFPSLDGIFYIVPLPLGPGGAPLEIRYGQLLGMALILSLGGLNYFGVRLGGGVQVGVTAVKVSLIFFIIIAAFGFGTMHARQAPAATSLTLSGFFAALVAALWAYDGWNNVSMVASEIQEPRRNLPLALIWGTASIIAIYLLTNAAYFFVLSPNEVGASNRVAADMMRKILGGPGAAAVSIAAMISIFAALNGSILAGSRVPYAMARDGRFFPAISRVHPAVEAACARNVAKVASSRLGSDCASLYAGKKTESPCGK